MSGSDATVPGMTKQRIVAQLAPHGPDAVLTAMLGPSVPVVDASGKVIGHANVDAVHGAVTADVDDATLAAAMTAGCAPVSIGGRGR